MPLVSLTNGKDRIRQAKPLVERFGQMQPGETISHLEMAQILGETYRTPGYRTALTTAKAQFWKATRIKMQPDWGNGVRMPTGDEQVADGVEWMRSGIRKVKRGAAIVSDVADERLTDQGRRQRDNVVLGAIALKRATDDAQKQMRAALKATPALPQTKA